MKAITAGGSAGLASASARTRNGWQVEVPERAPGFTEAGAGLSLGPTATRTASGGLLAIAGLHAAWAAGSAWPCQDRETLSDLVAGRPDRQMPPAAASLTVSALLSTAAALVGGYPGRLPRLRRLGAACVVAVLTVRGSTGVLGCTNVLVSWTPGERFRNMDRRYYGPLCLALAALASPAAIARSDPADLTGAWPVIATTGARLPGLHRRSGDPAG